MGEETRDKLFLCIAASVILVMIFLAREFYLAYPHYVQGAFALLILGLVFRGMRRRVWTRRMDCWLEYIHETPLNEADVDIAILYRYNDQEVTFYGKNASRAQAKTMFLPPLESWLQNFPAWVFDKREFLLKTLSYHYKIEYTGSVSHPTLSRVEDQAKHPSPEVPDQAEHENRPADYSWKLEKDDPNDYKGRTLTYEEPGFRCVTYMEMSGVSEFDWLGGDDDFATWTEPKDVPIDAYKHEELLVRLERWCRESRIRISLTPGMSREEYFWDEERRGNIVTHKDDGSVMISSAPVKPIWQRFRP